MKHTTQLPTKLPAAPNHLRGTTAKVTLVAMFVALALAGCGGNKDDEEAAPVASAPAAAATVVAAPAITVQPANLTVTELQPASFSVTATGAAPLSYEWRRNGTPMAGATSATLTIAAALAADHNAKYSVVVSNSAGSTASTEAVLTQELPMFLMAGQSNMEGNPEGTLTQSILAELASSSSTDVIKTNLTEQIRYFHLVERGGYRGYGYRPDMPAFEAAEMVRLRAAGLVGVDLTNPNLKVLCAWNSPTPSPLAIGKCGAPFGPELVFGQALSKAGYSSTSLIKVAVGGTNLYDDWRSPLMGGTPSAKSQLLYAKLRARIQSLQSDRTSVNPACKDRACKWSAFVWFQGEADSDGNNETPPTNSDAYEQNLKNLIADVRKDVGSPTLPVVIVQTGAWAQGLKYGKTVAAAQTAVVKADPNARIVNTADLSGYFHYDSAAQLIIGERVSLAVKSLLAAAPAAK